MISKTLLTQLEKLVKSGTTITYTDLNNTSDKSTISDPKNELHNAIKKGQIKEIVLAIYKNSSFKGNVGYDKNNNLHIIDGTKVGTLKVAITNDTLTIIDSINNKKTTIQYTQSKGVTPKETKLSLQNQLLIALKKKTLSNTEVMELIKNLGITKS